jgi:uncharacterized protein YutE (UPF0331/DUF86 family)
MKKLAIEKDVVLKRANGIENELVELKKLAEFSFEEFKTEKGFELGQYHLHRALEGVFNISAHILSRIPGGMATKYRDMAQNLGKYRIIDRRFAETKLIEMANYRNRLVHFYAEVTPKEIYRIIKKDLGDFDIFLAAVKKVLENPQQFGLEIE